MVNSLSNVSRKFILRARVIEQKFLSSPDVESACYCILSIYAEWERFVENLVLVSAVRRPVMENGARLTLAVEVATRGSFDIALCWAAAPRNGKRPKIIYWGDSRRVIPIVMQLGLANGASIVGAIGASNSCADDLRKLRNFVAHRNIDTWGSAKQVFSARSVEDVPFWLREIQPGGSQRFSVWCRNLELISIAATR